MEERERWLVTEPVEGDVESWLALVAEVEPLFGPMPDFETILRRNMNRHTALCVRDADLAVAGAMLLRGSPHAEIAWLAVRQSARGRGIGSALLAVALERYSGAPEVLVETFGEDNVAGRPARRLYEAFGFTAAESAPAGPEGGSRQIFRRRAQPA